jgi:hypothetical protein
MTVEDSMKTASFAIALALAACNGTTSIGSGTPSDTGGAPGSDDAGAGTTTEPSGPAQCPTSLTLKPENDYQLSVDARMELTHVAPNSDLTFDWSGVTQDYLGRTLDPKNDISELELSLIGSKLPGDELDTTLSMLDDSSVGSLLQFAPLQAVTQVNATDMTPALNAPPGPILQYFDPVPFSGFDYLLSASSDFPFGTRMLAAFTLDAQSSNTSVVMTSRSTNLSYTAHLDTLVPLQLAQLTTDGVLDWSELGVDVYGRTLSALSLREVHISEYSLPLAELEANVMTLDAGADHVFRAEIGPGMSLDFSAFLDDEGNQFPGIVPNGRTWFLAIYDDQRFIPAPIFVTRLESCGSAQ